MFFLVFAAWIVGVGVSLFLGNRVLPTVVLLLGAIAIFAMFHHFGGSLAFAGLAILAVVIWISNKVEMT